MIISHKHRYVFVELPQTASTAISSELRAHYDGFPILRKHATYLDFLRVASAEEKTFFVFSGMRNPLDRAVTLYHKIKSDHGRRFTSSQKWRRNNRYLHYLLSARRRYEFVRIRGADFATYFRRFYMLPYDDWSNLSHKGFDFVIEFGNLQCDFAKVLGLLGIEQVGPLPWLNRTVGKTGDFPSYYTPDIIGRAKWVFGPFMREWGYDFPPDWGDATTNRMGEVAFGLVRLFRKLYWRHLSFLGV